jgi:hypothetical protein
MRDSNYVRTFPLKTPYFIVSSAGVLNTVPKFAEWLAGLGFIEDSAGVVFITQNHPSNGFAVKTSTSTPAQVLVPMDYISRLQASSGVLIVVGPLTTVFTVPTPAANQNLFVFKNGLLLATNPTTIPLSATDTYAILLTNDLVA